MWVTTVRIHHPQLDRVREPALIEDAVAIDRIGHAIEVRVRARRGSLVSPASVCSSRRRSRRTSRTCHRRAHGTRSPARTAAETRSGRRRRPHRGLVAAPYRGHRGNRGDCVQRRDGSPRASGCQGSNLAQTRLLNGADVIRVRLRAIVARDVQVDRQLRVMSRVWDVADERQACPIGREAGHRDRVGFETSRRVSPRADRQRRSRRPRRTGSSRSWPARMATGPDAGNPRRPPASPRCAPRAARGSRTAAAAV